MKKLVKQKWFPFVVALTLVVAFLGFLYHIGFRITYDRKLENSWDAISACAAWAGVGASFVAIWFAIRVPKKIADRQDKIALFEKRYHAYTSVLTLKSFAHALDYEFLKDDTPDEHGLRWHISAKAGLCCVQFATSFGYQPKLVKDKLNVESVSQTIMILKQFETDLYTLPFVFNFTSNEKDKIEKEISEILEPLFMFMTEVTTYDFQPDSEIDDYNRQVFIDKIEIFTKKYAERLESELKL